jgi:hypothetical protein
MIPRGIHALLIEGPIVRIGIVVDKIYGSWLLLSGELPNLDAEFSGQLREEVELLYVSVSLLQHSGSKQTSGFRSAATSALLRDNMSLF